MSQIAEQSSNVAVIPRSNFRELTPAQVGLLHRTLCIGASEDDVSLFAGICQRTGLDPFARQICMVMRDPQNGGHEEPAIMVTVDGFRLIAERTNQYLGQKPHQWCGEDGVWKDVWLEEKPPVAARVGVMRKGFTEPLYAVAKWSTYAQTYYNNDTGLWEYTHAWTSMMDLMLSKCAECLALRRAFPNDLGGLYSVEETKGQGLSLYGGIFEQSKDQPEQEQEADDDVDDLPPALVTSGTSARSAIEAQVSDEAKAQINKLVRRAYENKTFAIASQWAKESLTGAELQYFGNQLLAAQKQ